MMMMLIVPLSTVAAEFFALWKTFLLFVSRFEQIPQKKYVIN